MDRSIGKVLDTLKELNIEEETLVIFTADNGPENGAGTAGPYKGVKRSLHEGGVRVPTIVQWKGVIPSNSITTSWFGMTDLFPTFLDAASIPRPNDLHMDGVSMLPALTRAVRLDKLAAFHNQGKHATGKVSNDSALAVSNVIKSTAEFQNMLRNLYRMQHHAHHHHHHNTKHDEDSSSSGESDTANEVDPLLERFGSNGVLPWPGIDKTKTRIFLWHKDTDPYHNEERIESAAYYSEIKIMTATSRGCLDRIYDMRHDPYEHRNLIANTGKRLCLVNLMNPSTVANIEKYIDKNAAKSHCEHQKHDGIEYSNSLGNAESTVHSVEACLTKYNNGLIEKIQIMFPKLANLARYGNKAHQHYMHHDMNKAICSIPLPEQAIKLHWYHQSATNCTERIESDCSMPEY